MNASTVIVTPPMRIIGIRGYTEDSYGKHPVFDIYAKEIPKSLNRKFDVKYNEESISKAEKNLDDIKDVVSIVSVFPNAANLSQKKPFVFEVPVSGKTVKEKYDYIRSILGKDVRISEIFQNGQFTDVLGITRGKGVEGPVTRFGVKRKQHKSRKSVRALGTLGPISPAVVMYTVARQGQRGFHQRTEYNKRILSISSTENDKEYSINPNGGFKHFGLVKGDYIVVRGSVPGVPKRLVKLRQPIRKLQKKVLEPKVVEVLSK
jgi:large subunit ribosomal protein L3